MYGSKFWTVAPLVAVIACAGDRVIAPGPTQVAPGPLSASQTASSLTALRRDESFLASFLERLERRSEVGTSSTRQQALVDLADVRHSLQATRARIAELERAKPDPTAGRFTPGGANRIYQCTDDGSGCDGGGGGGGGGTGGGGGGGDGTPVYPEGTVGKF